MRILGACPNCEAFDAISEGSASAPEEVRCYRCETTWPDWEELLLDEQRKGRRLIPVSIFAHRSGVKLLLPPKAEVPWADTITVALNAALLAKYQRLRTCLASEGGVEGLVGHRYVELFACSDLIGLSNGEIVYLGDPWHPSDWVLRFYARMLRELFAEPLRSRRAILRPGAILWLPPEGSDNHLAAWDMIALMLRNVGGAQLPTKAQEVLRAAHPLEKMYLRGPTDRELAQRFVVPPGLEHLFGSSRES